MRAFPPCQVSGCIDEGKGYPADLELERKRAQVTSSLWLAGKDIEEGKEPEVKYTCLDCEAKHWAGLLANSPDQAQRERAAQHLMMLQRTRRVLVELRNDPMSRSYRGNA